MEKESKGNAGTTVIRNICAEMLVLTRRWMREKLITMLRWPTYVINITKTCIYIYIYIYIYEHFNLFTSLHLLVVSCSE